MSLINFAGFVIHLLFTPLWGWGPDLANLKTTNRRSAITMNGMMSYTFAFFGVADLLWGIGVLEVQSILVAGMTGFWLVRTVLQLVYFDLRQPLSIVFMAAFIFMTAGHAFVLIA